MPEHGTEIKEFLAVEEGGSCRARDKHEQITRRVFRDESARKSPPFVRNAVHLFLDDIAFLAGGLIIQRASSRSAARGGRNYKPLRVISRRLLFFPIGLVRRNNVVHSFDARNGSCFSFIFLFDPSVLNISGPQKP